MGTNVWLSGLGKPGFDVKEEYVDRCPYGTDDPKDTQIGGNHYQLPIQPIDFITKNKLGFIEGNIIKYVVRHDKKNGLEDLEKAKHYLEMLMKEYK